MGEGDIIKDTYPPSKLGEYTVIQEIAEGTFGKVKSESALSWASSPHVERYASGDTYRDGTQGCHEIHIQASNPCDKNEDESAARG